MLCLTGVIAAKVLPHGVLLAPGSEVDQHRRAPVGPQETADHLLARPQLHWLKGENQRIREIEQESAYR